MHNTRYRQLEMLILGASPEKLAAPRRLDVRVPVDIGHCQPWQASSGQVNALIDKMAMLGGTVQAQKIDGEWAAIYRYRVRYGQPQGCNAATGQWFEVRAVRQVLNGPARGL